MTKKKKTGPKPSGNVTRAIRIHPDNINWYERQVDKSGSINALIRASKDEKKKD